MKSKILSLLLLLSCTSAYADPISGRVVDVTNGDTLTILDESHTQHKIHLAAIVAPDLAQPFGREAKDMLSRLCNGQLAYINVVCKDKHGRPVGEVDCAGTNANEEMIRSGYAWVNREYAMGHGHLYPMEEEMARAEKRGLWADPNPVPPWEWRKMPRE